MQLSVVKQPGKMATRTSKRAVKPNQRYTSEEYELPAKKKGRIQQKEVQVSVVEPVVAAAPAAPAATAAATAPAAPLPEETVPPQAPDLEEAAADDVQQNPHEEETDDRTAKLIQKAKEQSLTQEEQEELVLALYNDISFAGFNAGISSF